MSADGLKQNIGKFILEEFEKTKLGSNGRKDPKATRKELNRSTGQIFIINEIDVRQEIDFIAQKLKIETLDGTEFAALMKSIDRVFETSLKAKLTPDRLEDITGLLNWLKNKNSNPKLHYYIITNYRQVQDSKTPSGKLNSAFTSSLASKFKKKNPTKAREIANAVTGLAKKGADLTGFQLGHGEYGGLAASTVNVAKVKQAGFNKFVEGSKEREVFQQVIHEYEKTLNLNIRHNQILTSSGKLNKNYIVVLSLQGAESNQADNRYIERPALDLLQKRAKDFVLLKSSTKLVDGIEKVLLYDLAKGLKSKTRYKPKRQIREKSSSKQKGRAKFSHKRQVLAAGGLVGKIENDFNKENKGQSSTPALLNLLTAKISGVVQKNMNAPALENRTGRFANSVEILGVNNGAIPIINYTYQKDPYQVFEQTQPWANGQRDPRDLIERSIREIAAEGIAGKFLTRRI